MTMIPPAPVGSPEVAPPPPEVRPLAVKAALAASFARTFNASIVSGRLTDNEERMAVQLVRERYGNDGWNLQKRE